jgi:RNA polymerase sigma factor (sigma-70 family)
MGIDPYLSGFVYDVFFAGIPCRDPTPEMEARYDRLGDPLDRGGPVSRRAGDWLRAMAPQTGVRRDVKKGVPGIASTPCFQLPPRALVSQGLAMSAPSTGESPAFLSGFSVLIRYRMHMPLDHETTLKHLFEARRRLSAAAWLIVRDAQAAEDLFQNVALKSVTKQVSFEHEGALLSWAMVSIKRESIDWLRKRKPETLGLEPEVLDLISGEWSAPALPEGQRMEALRECLASVPDHSRQLLHLRYFEGHSCDEVARRVGASVEAVYQRLSRLHRQLKQCVDARLQKSGLGFSPSAEDLGGTQAT